MLAYTSPCVFASALMITKGKVAWTVLCPGLLACCARVVIPGFADCGRARQEAAETAQAGLEAERARAGELATELAAARAALSSAHAAGEAERAAASQAAARVRIGYPLAFPRSHEALEHFHLPYRKKPRRGLLAMSGHF